MYIYIYMPFIFFIFIYSLATYFFLQFEDYSRLGTQNINIDKRTAFI